MRIYPSVAVIVLNYNGFDLTKECLYYISMDPYPNKKVFLIDNCSTKEGEVQKLHALSEYYDHFFQIVDRNRGFSGGMNFGAWSAMSKGDFKYLVFVSNDVCIDKNFLENVVISMESDEKIGLSSPIQYVFNENFERNEIYFAGSIITPIINHTKHIKKVSKNNRIDYVVGAVFAARTKCFNDLGGYDEYYYSWYEDCDLSLRAKKGGWKLSLIHQAIAWHKVSQTVGKRNKDMMSHSIYYHSRNRILFVKRNKPKLEFFLFLIYLFAFSVPWFSFKKVAKSLLKRDSYEMNKQILKAYYRGIRDAWISRSGQELKVIPSIEA